MQGRLEIVLAQASVMLPPEQGLDSVLVQSQQFGPQALGLRVGADLGQRLGRQFFRLFPQLGMVALLQCLGDHLLNDSRLGLRPLELFDPVQAFVGKPCLTDLGIERHNEKHHGADAGNSLGRVAPEPFPGARDEWGWLRPDRLVIEITPNIIRQFLGGGVTLVPVLFQTLETNGLQIARHPGLQLARRHRVHGEDQPDRDPRGWPQEGGPPREQLVQDGPQGVGVGGRADLVVAARGLFGGHVAGGTHDRARDRLARVALQLLGEAEVGDLGLVVPR